MGYYISTVKEYVMGTGNSAGMNVEIDLHEGHGCDTCIIFDRNKKFRDNYMIGQSMGSSHYGEVRKCKNIRSKAIRAVKIYKKLINNELEI